MLRAPERPAVILKICEAPYMFKTPLRSATSTLSPRMLLCGRPPDAQGVIMSKGRPSSELKEASIPVVGSRI